MESTSISPVKVSSDLVHSYYYVTFDHKKKLNSGVIIDDASYELMFVKEKNVKIVTGDDKRYLLTPAYTLNFLKSPFRFEFPDSFTNFCIKLQPWMNASYVPVVKSQLLNLNKIYGVQIDELHHNIFSSETTAEMAAYAEDFLLSLPIEMNLQNQLIKDICMLVYEKSGNITVNEISERFNIYRQKLNSVFKQEVKYTLKTFINLIRIRACLGYKIKNPEVSLTEIGHHFGYYDQAHFIRSFKKACGITPSEYVKKSGYSFQV